MLDIRHAVLLSWKGLQRTFRLGSVIGAVLNMCEKSERYARKTGTHACGMALALTLAIALQTKPSSAETKAGVAAAVENKVMGILHGNPQLLSVGSDVFMDQVVRTEDESTTQLLLLDKTDISVGTNSEVVLDRFVFDPDRPKGDVILTATRGVFRFVTGTQDHSSYHIKTPAATIGVRVTVVQFYIPELPQDGSKPKDIFQLVLESGQADVTKLDGEVVPINETGILFTIHSDGSHDQRPWVGKLSLYESHLGDVTGALGARGAGAGAGGGPTNPFFQRGNTGGGNGGGGNPPPGGPPGPQDLLTFTGTTTTTTNRPVSP